MMLAIASVEGMDEMLHHIEDKSISINAKPKGIPNARYRPD